MKVLVIGAGNMGSAFVRQLSAAGHQVSVTSRDLSKATSLAAQYPGVRQVPAAGAAAQVDAIIVATSQPDAIGALQSVGDLTGKVIVDIANPLTADYMGLTIGHDTSAAEELARSAPGAEVVKAFNTVFAQVLAAGPDFGGGRRVSVFIASDSQRARQTATALADSLGFETIDAGGLKNARYLEPLGGLNVYLGYGAGLGTAIAPTWISQN